MNILIFNNKEPLYTLYTRSESKNLKSIDDLNGVYLTNLSQFDSICKSSDLLRLLPHNYFGIDIFDHVRLLVKKPDSIQADSCLKYLSKVSDLIQEHFSDIDTTEGRSLPYVYADYLSKKLYSASLFSAPFLPLFQKNYFLRDRKGCSCVYKTFKMTNIEVYDVLKGSLSSEVDYLLKNKVDIPIFLVAGQINRFYLEEQDYFVTVSFKSSLPDIWMFYLGVFSFNNVVIHSSIFKLLIKYIDLEFITVTGLSVAEHRAGFGELSNRFKCSNSLASWFTNQTINTVIIHSLHYCANPIAVALVSRLRSAIIAKAIQIDNLGINVSSVGAGELTLFLTHDELVSVKPRLRELLLYET